MINVALIDYNMGNLGSVAKALQVAGAKLQVIEKNEELKNFDAAILPGVGNFGDGMESLRSRGWCDTLKAYAASGRPLLGICLGMQMMLERSEEAPKEDGLGFFPGSVTLFPEGMEKVPQIGWNQVHSLEKTPLLDGISDNSFFYFVHSYYVPKNPEYTLAETEYILPFSSLIGRKNVFGAQFHPEKSQDAGLRLLKNFIAFAEKTR